jgi:hypothetical protein
MYSQIQQTRRIDMETLVRCKACGFITDQGKIKDICPACGVPSKMFETYTHPVSLKRRRILELHTHPVLVHFPQAFAITLFLLSVASLIAPVKIQGDLISTIQVLTFLLPFFVIGAIATGLMDGKLRFRKVTTPLLKQKIIISIVFIITSIVMATLVLSGQLKTSSIHIVYILLTMVVSLCGALLGLIGGKLLDAKFPG